MTATNHVLTGILIAAVVPNPVIALPLALLSHFVLDSLPHYGDISVPPGSTKFNIYLGIDSYLALMCLVTVLLLHPPHTPILILAGIIAASPDLMWLPEYINGLRGLPTASYGPIQQLHSRIQKSQTPGGIKIEAVWFGAMVVAALILAI